MPNKTIRKRNRWSFKKGLGLTSFKKRQFFLLKESSNSTLENGPFQVLQCVNNNTCRINMSGKYVVHTTFNVSGLFPFIGGFDDKIDQQI